ncbi:hypothetical protein BATDEDRAFT_37087 [Batrachochytrium dendrobatidis JAM81]|uniref:Uncharacterized protein n=2 Tax=Batrachochytrium dendrobatidis TaxID=109871 RepID=F4P562_BATDJ|nr:uncharacterized protein BATDEDRAFT_37087 [Batrachochytrium dendrobatidis JAM81]EGF80028.1 hypothetical protein BATDEDRAFT_37087 [Batrachochytrium dendrobatidis JAM81]KAJ8324997.1 hypothetical protein O5D80_006510 [Batrachochytrium dendrobatidis]KAK5672780.1 hypothetical protein QVD99_000275 [Batrachochytrium dendrobatidis]OAJ39074.1 hypothetical protein BDEG_22948 [Batrachochytrium dendrobatidis JEL423]|eukprot:XP_006679613.1 hypothetical protein BATDEDRAFT_37087 [Batrachochytrium dendrobatidis JAM81]
MAGLAQMSKASTYVRRFATAVSPSVNTSNSSTKTSTDGNLFLQVSTPHPVSNIRLLRLSVYAKQTLSDTDIAMLQKRIDVQERHHIFWTANNTDFQSKKSAYIQAINDSAHREPTSAEMSYFYKSYLDDSYSRHSAYNTTLWKENTSMLIPGIKADMRQLSHVAGGMINNARERLVDARYFTWLYLKRQITHAFSDSSLLYQAHGVTVR